MRLLIATSALILISCNSKNDLLNNELIASNQQIWEFTETQLFGFKHAYANNSYKAERWMELADSLAWFSSAIVKSWSNDTSRSHDLAHQQEALLVNLNYEDSVFPDLDLSDLEKEDSVIVKARVGRHLVATLNFLLRNIGHSDNWPIPVIYPQITKMRDSSLVMLTTGLDCLPKDWFVQYNHQADIIFYRNTAIGFFLIDNDFPNNEIKGFVSYNIPGSTRTYKMPFEILMDTIRNSNYYEPFFLAPTE